MPVVKVTIAVDNVCGVYSYAYPSEEVLGNPFKYWAWFASSGDKRKNTFTSDVKGNPALSTPTPLVSKGEFASVSLDCEVLPSHIYVVAYSDRKNRQGLYADVDVSGQTLFLSGSPAWSVQAAPHTAPVADTLAITTSIAPTCDVVNDLFGAWKGRSLTSSEWLHSNREAYALGLPSWRGKWMWYLNNAATPTFPLQKQDQKLFVDRRPFTPGADHGEYFAFRVKLPLPPSRASFFKEPTPIRFP